jgi:hypothetical protein
MQILLWQILTWVFREIVIKFLVFTAVFALVALLVPYAVSYLTSFIGTGPLTSAFSALPAGVWYFLDLFRAGFGIPLCISAMVSAFMIRRLPVIG